ncbi:hypothetical protein FQA39_LY19284 [Lamprigera yunnana]|nr:hypothetical protein FQA39_LY19284 [Lamprigera yunnana]
MQLAIMPLDPIADNGREDCPEMMSFLKKCAESKDILMAVAENTTAATGKRFAMLQQHYSRCMFAAFVAIAEIMNAYPDLKIKQVIYRQQRNEDSNQRIIQSRAQDCQKLKLLELEYSADRREALKGYGSLHPVCETNDTG